MKTLLVTGGCGFIGSNFVRFLTAETDWRIVTLDKLTYAGNLANLDGVPGERHRFVLGDICDRPLVESILKEEKPWAVVNFAAESHVDRSILDAAPFLETNITGVQTLLEAVRSYPVERFVQISTDEVYGDREKHQRASEDTPLKPSSPYAASKASADLICFSYRRTYALPILITRSSNNYGPFQFPEKLIPLMIRNALNDEELPVYGDGCYVRDWLYVEDNCRAIAAVLENGQLGEVYNIGTGEERTNLDVLDSVCDAIAARKNVSSGELKKRIRHVVDRPGHDRRYALDLTKIGSEIAWKPRTEFTEGIEQTVEWYMDRPDWVRQVTSGEYRKYYEAVYRREWGVKAGD
jgi:dTDP-glucose 4,6-dehydratase